MEDKAEGAPIRGTPTCLLVEQSSDDIEEVSGDSTRLRIDNTVEDIEDGDIRGKKAESEGNDIEVVEDTERKSRSNQRIGVKRKQPDSSRTQGASKEDEGPPTQRRKLRDVVAELVKIWDSPISDPLDTPELRRRKEKKQKELMMRGMAQGKGGLPQGLLLQLGIKK